MWAARHPNLSIVKINPYKKISKRLTERIFKKRTKQNSWWFEGRAPFSAMTFTMADEALLSLPEDMTIHWVQLEKIREGRAIHLHHLTMAKGGPRVEDDLVVGVGVHVDEGLGLNTPASIRYKDPNPITHSRRTITSRPPYWPITKGLPSIKGSPTQEQGRIRNPDHPSKQELTTIRFWSSIWWMTHQMCSNAQLHSNDSRRLRITPDDSYRLIVTQRIDDSEGRGGV